MKEARNFQPKKSSTKLDKFSTVILSTLNCLNYKAVDSQQHFTKQKLPYVSTVGFYSSIESKSLFLKKDMFLLTLAGIKAIPLFECKMVDKVEVKALKGFVEACVPKETIC